MATTSGSYTAIGGASELDHIRKYIKAYQREGGKFWWTLDHGYKSPHFKPLAFNESYTKAGGLCRTLDKKLSEVIPSRMHLDKAVTCLLTMDPETKGKASHETNKCIANSLLLCTTMLSEGIRFHAIVDFCTRNDDNINPKQLGTDLMGLVQTWGKISEYLLDYYTGQECLINNLADLAKCVAVIKDVNPIQTGKNIKLKNIKLRKKERRK